MASTKDYLDKLNDERNQLADNLVKKGVEASREETLDSLVPKVLDIPAGGMEIIGEKVKGIVADGQDIGAGEFIHYEEFDKITKVLTFQNDSYKGNYHYVRKITDNKYIIFYVGRNNAGAYASIVTKTNDNSLMTIDSSITISNSTSNACYIKNIQKINDNYVVFFIDTSIDGTLKYIVINVSENYEMSIVKEITAAASIGNYNNIVLVRQSETKFMCVYGDGGYSSYYLKYCTFNFDDNYNLETSEIKTSSTYIYRYVSAIQYVKFGNKNILFTRGDSGQNVMAALVFEIDENDNFVVIKLTTTNLFTDYIADPNDEHSFIPLDDNHFIYTRYGVTVFELTENNSIKAKSNLRPSGVSNVFSILKGDDNQIYFIYSIYSVGIHIVKLNISDDYVLSMDEVHKSITKVSPYSNSTPCFGIVEKEPNKNEFFITVSFINTAPFNVIHSTKKDTVSKKTTSNTINGIALTDGTSGKTIQICISTI